MSMTHAICLVLISFVACLVFYSCKTSKVNPEQYQKRKIYFGNGGGFTGRIKEFCMLDNGEIYRINPSTREVNLRNITKKSEAKSFFKAIEELNIHQYTYDKPGNRFFWLKYHSPEHSTYLIWGDASLEVDEKILKVYDQLVEMTRKNENK